MSQSLYTPSNWKSNFSLGEEMLTLNTTEMSQCCFPNVFDQFFLFWKHLLTALYCFKSCRMFVRMNKLHLMLFFLAGKTAEL